MWKLRFASLGLMLSAVASSWAAAPLTVLTHEVQPFGWQERGQSFGFAYELVLETMQELGDALPIDFVSFRRGLQQVQSQQKKVFFILNRTPEREHTVKWVGPLIKSSTYMYQRKGAGLNLRNLDDLRKTPAIGLQIGLSEDTYLTTQGFTNIYRSTSKALTVRALVNKRVDAIPLSQLAVPSLLREEGLPADAIEQTPLKLFDNDFYIAFSKDVSDETIQRWQKALDKVKRDHYETLFAKYFH